MARAARSKAGRASTTGDVTSTARRTRGAPAKKALTKKAAVAKAYGNTGHKVAGKKTTPLVKKTVQRAPRSRVAGSEPVTRQTDGRIRPASQTDGTFVLEELKQAQRAVVTGAEPGANIQQVLKAYREQLSVALEQSVVPAVLDRLRRGATVIAPQELARRMLAVTPAPAPLNKMAEQVGPTFYDTAGVSVVLAGPSRNPVSKQAIDHRRRRNTILALQTADNRWIYPTWQFQDHEVMPGLVEVLEAFDGHPAWSVATWLTTPSVEFHAETAVDRLQKPDCVDDVVRAARQVAARWAA